GCSFGMIPMRSFMSHNISIIVEIFCREGYECIYPVPGSSDLLKEENNHDRCHHRCTPLRIERSHRVSGSPRCHLPDPCLLYRRCDRGLHQERGDPEVLQPRGEKISQLRGCICLRGRPCRLLLHHPADVCRHPEERERDRSCHYLPLCGSCHQHPRH